MKIIYAVETKIESAPRIGDRIRQVMPDIACDCILTGTVVAVNKKHRHYTMEFVLPPKLCRRYTARFKGSFKY